MKHQRDQTRKHEHAHGGKAQRFQRLDLLGDDHRAQLRGDRRADASAVAGGPADLAVGRVDRHRRPIDARADGRRQILRVVQPLDVVPVELQADQPARRTAGGDLALERAPADEVAPCRS